MTESAGVVMHIETAARSAESASAKTSSAPAESAALRRRTAVNRNHERQNQADSYEISCIHFFTSSTTPLSETYVPAFVCTVRSTPCGGSCVEESASVWTLLLGLNQTVPLCNAM